MSRNISKDNAHIFRTIVTKLLFLRKQAWPGILSGVAFLPTMAIEPEKYDKNKMIHFINFLQITRKLVLALESD